MGRVEGIQARLKLQETSKGLTPPSMSNEVAQPTEHDLSRPTGVESTKANKPPALDTSACMYSIPYRAVT